MHGADGVPWCDLEIPEVNLSLRPSVAFRV